MTRTPPLPPPDAARLLKVLNGGALTVQEIAAKLYFGEWGFSAQRATLGLIRDAVHRGEITWSYDAGRQRVTARRAK